MNRGSPLGRRRGNGNERRGRRSLFIWRQRSEHRGRGLGGQGGRRGWKAPQATRGAPSARRRSGSRSSASNQRIGTDRRRCQGQKRIGRTPNAGGTLGQVQLVSEFL